MQSNDKSTGHVPVLLVSVVRGKLLILLNPNHWGTVLLVIYKVHTMVFSLRQRVLVSTATLLCKAIGQRSKQKHQRNTGR